MIRTETIGSEVCTCLNLRLGCCGFSLNCPYARLACWRMDSGSRAYASRNLRIVTDFMESQGPVACCRLPHVLRALRGRGPRVGLEISGSPCPIALRNGVHATRVLQSHPGPPVAIWRLRRMPSRGGRSCLRTESGIERWNVDSRRLSHASHELSSASRRLESSGNQSYRHCSNSTSGGRSAMVGTTGASSEESRWGARCHL